MMIAAESVAIIHYFKECTPQTLVGHGLVNQHGHKHDGWHKAHTMCPEEMELGSKTPRLQGQEEVAQAEGLPSCNILSRSW